MAKILTVIPQKVIEICFYLLFLLVPVILTPINYELFEYNKMMLTYGLTAIIVGSWIIKIIIQKRINIKRTPLDLPLLLFLASQIVSTIFSVDRHVSIWGYYSRFNGGLLSTISYFLLYYSFVNNFPREKIKKLLKVALISGLLVSVYGILEHLGIDKNIWVQDVQNRVFATLGQPNWLAAYLAILIPISVGLGLQNLININFKSDDKVQRSKFKDKTENIFNFGFLSYWVIGLIFYATLIFTKSRSGFLGFWIADFTLWTILIWKYKKYILQSLFIVHCTLFIVTFLFGAPFDQINRFSFSALSHNPQLTTNNQLTKPTGGSVIEVGITESGTIRRIVWQGAADIFRHYPLFGTGVETFAFSYYKYRPVEHNMTSEWDFLYNKAHNEYLNYAATTGAFGLGSYLLIIITFIIWFLVKNTKFEYRNSKQFQNPNIKNPKRFENSYFEHSNLFRASDFEFSILMLGLFSGWLTILITNFFGFSVVIIQLFFFLIPAISFNLINESDNRHQTTDNNKMTNLQYILISGMLFVICFLLFVLGRLWYADVIFADGYHRARAQEVTSSYQSLKRALEINYEEPLYYDEFSFPAAEIAVAFNDEKQATLSASVTKEAIIASNFAITHAPQNVNFWKTRTRVFYALSVMDEKYFADSLNALEQARVLAPTDPKIRYNLGLLYDRMGKKQEAINELITTTKLKPDYRDAFYALAYLYEKDGKRDKAKEELKYILTKIATDDAEVRKKLEELK